MYKKRNMLREKRKHANYKPNRRLDAKSSRGMIYENEELRIRTININAEVERGQSEIKNLKREREQLRREIWTLRDEYDKLENLLRIKGIDPEEFLNQDKSNEAEDENLDNVSECSECSCESCCNAEYCENQKNEPASSTNFSENPQSALAECAAETSHKTDLRQNNTSDNKTQSDDHSSFRSGKERMNLNFDHLSIVTEESSEVNSISQNEDNVSNIPINDLSSFLHKVDALSPLSYLQKLSPSLAHFENLPYNEIGANVDLHGNITSTDSKPNKNSSTVANSPLTNNGESEKFQSVKSSEPVVVAPAAIAKKESRLKHFFSPIRKKQPQPQAISEADVFISNVLPNNIYLQNYPVIPAETATTPDITNENNTEVTSPSSSFQTGGNLEELLYDIEALSKDIMNLQTQCIDMPNDDNSSLSKPKPFRSELNLVLSYPSDMSPPSELKESVNEASESSRTALVLQTLPSPYPSATFPSSPITPPTNFNNTDFTENYFENKLPEDYSHLRFTPLNTNTGIYSSTNSIFCTVSAPSTPSTDRRKCIEKFCSTETTNDISSYDKKKAKRVSIVNMPTDINSDKSNEANSDNKELENKDSSSKKTTSESNCASNSCHHSHAHRNHSHHPKRRMSLDSTSNVAKHKNHRQIGSVPRRESNRSVNSFKKRSRSDSTFAGHEDQGGTSMSERYSNSIASSRESSTSLSLKSGKRRISITSYGNSKKIPWVRNSYSLL